MSRLSRHGATNPAIKQWVNNLTGLDFEKLVQVDTAIRRVYRFRNEIQELIRTPEFMMEDWITRGYLEGDCDDISTFTAAVVGAIGLRVRFVAIRTDPATMDFKHVFVEVFVDGNWYRLDATVSNQTDMQYYGERMVQNV